MARNSIMLHSIVVFFFAFGVATASHFPATSPAEFATGACDEVEDGVYSLSKTGTKVVDKDGGEWFLDRRHEVMQNRATLESIANDNGRYRLWLVVGFDEQPVNEWFVYIIDGHCIQISSWGPTADNNVDLYADVSDEQTIEMICKHFEIEPEPRRHPGHQLHVTCATTENVFAVGDPAVVELSIRNDGEEDVMFMDGGQQRGSRNNQFRFIAFSQHGSGPAIPDIGDPVNFGGIGGFVTLKPGDTFKKQVDLQGWFEFKDPDSYQLTCVFQIDLLSSDGNNPVIWNDFAVAECVVRIGE